MMIEAGTPASDPISDDALYIIYTVNYCSIIGIISVFGTICNIINIIVFVKQGFKDTTNISFIGISVADMGSLVTLLWGAVCMNPLLVNSFEDVELAEINYVIAGWPHVYFVRVAGCLIGLVTVERYLCVAYPLKVRSLVTPKRTVALNISMFVIMTVDIFPVFTTTSLAHKFNPVKNRTTFGIMYTQDAQTVQDIISYFNNCTELLSFVLVTILTIMLVQKLNSKRKWRSLNLIKPKGVNLLTRDHKIARMVIFISTIFILCYLPIVGVFVAMKFEMQLSVTGWYKNLFSTLGITLFLLEAISSSANIFVYLRMSSKYREVFMTTFMKPPVKQ